MIYRLISDITFIGPEDSYSDAGSEKEEFLKTESEEKNPETRREKEENLKARTEKKLNLGSRTANKSRIVNKENRVAEYVPKEEEVDDRLGSESANYSLFKSCRLKRKRKLVNNTASQVQGVLFNMNFNKLIRINYLINYID